MEQESSLLAIGQSINQIDTEQQSQQAPTQSEPSELESSHQHPSEQSELSIAETEPTLDHQSESGQSTNSNGSATIDEHLSMGEYEKVAAQMIDNSLKRKELSERDLDVVCSAAKKCKSSEEAEDVAAVALPAECE